ncbi:MAG: ECF RNA polymerase sigma factor SigW [Gammaproteobacteria bacterium]|nr:ECF RNA polymerase sigma factor SigW [Gammaproteobacteria bacterium]
MDGWRQNAYAEVDESELVRKIVEGDEAGFEYLVRRFGGRMLAVARRITGNEADAQDCLQEALLKSYSNIGQFQGRSGLNTWLHRIVVNVSLMRLRSQKRAREDSLDPLLPDFDGHGMRVGDAPIAGVEEIEEMYEQGRTRAAVRAAIERLPNDYRAIVIARDIEQLNTSETAQLLGISTSLVKTRLHRARAALKRLLDPVEI